MIATNKLYKPSFGIGILSILYFVGIIGALTTIHKDFLLLTPFNLLISVGISLLFHPKWDRAFIIWLIFVFFWGFGAEVFGVQTGLLFGSYNYGAVLGWKWADTPIIIGINWILVTYCCGITINHLWQNGFWLWKALFGATLMVILDVFIEPVAITYNFWTWENGVVPLQNYFGWWLVALPLMLVFMRIQGQTRNKVAVALLFLQFLFLLLYGYLVPRSWFYWNKNW